MAEGRKEEGWIGLIRCALEAQPWMGGYIVCFPEYRPDLVVQMAHSLGLVHFDFRYELMRPLGWGAGSLQLEDLDRAIAERAEESGVVVQNAEALLSTKAAGLRRRWLRDFLLAAWPNAAILPLTLYASEIPRQQPRVVALDARALPEPTLLSRLLG